MPKVVKPKCKSRASLPPPPPPPRPKSTRSPIDKSTLITILIARLGEDRSFDWHELSLKTSISADEIGKGKRKGKAGSKGKKEEREGVSGTELHDIYYDIILPSLRRGEMPWERKTTEWTSDYTPPPETPPNVASATEEAQAAVKGSKKASASKARGRAGEASRKMKTA